MPILAAVVYSASLVHLCSVAAAEEDEHSDSELVACLAAIATSEVAWLGSELVLDSEELLASVADFYWLDSVIVGNLEWHGS